MAVQHDSIVKVGSDSGEPVFEPSSLAIYAGCSVTFITSQTGHPYNIVFDEDAVPAGVNAEDISCIDYLCAPGEKYTVTLKVAGEYSYYCEPYQGAGMKGTITVV